MIKQVSLLAVATLLAVGVTAGAAQAAGSDGVRQARSSLPPVLFYLPPSAVVYSSWGKQPVYPYMPGMAAVTQSAPPERVDPWPTLPLGN